MNAFFEAVMIICFGTAWPFSIARSYRARRNSGKSLPFLVIILVGYVAGIVHKLINSRDLVIWLYVLNTVMVTIDIALYLRNRSIEAREAEADRG